MTDSKTKTVSPGVQVTQLPAIQAAQQPSSALGDQCAIPSGFALVDLQAWKDAPPRPGERLMNVDTVPSLIVLLDRLGANTPQTIIYCRARAQGGRDGRQIAAVLNEGTQDSPGRGDFLVRLLDTFDDRYLMWKRHSEEFHGLQATAEFLEDRLGDVADEKDRTALMEAALHMEARRDVKVVNRHRLDNGAAGFEYTEEINGQIANGQINLPTTFSLTLPVYLGQEAIEIPMRFKYRVSADGLLTVRLEVVDAALLETKAFELQIAEVRKSKATVIEGVLPDCRIAKDALIHANHERRSL